MQLEGERDSDPSLEIFENIDRASWAKLIEDDTSPLSEAEVVQLRGLGDPLNLNEVSEVYLPLSRLIYLHLKSVRDLHRRTNAFLDGNGHTTPFVIGIAGSVAVGKSTVARLMRELLRRWPDTPTVEMVTTDGFLFPNAELKKRGLMERKGFPESYDQRALLNFVSQVKSGVKEVRAPRYSHVTYDIVPDAEIIIHEPDILIVEGLNVLQPPRQGSALAVSDLFDFTIYIDANLDDLEGWYIDRFLALKAGTFNNPNSYFHRYSSLSNEEAVTEARRIWHAINKPNLVENIEPTRSRANLVLNKSGNHRVDQIYLRKM
ncbi:MAG: type I pantothenate kinase [Microbacteriaceae bacterium]